MGDRGERLKQLLAEHALGPLGFDLFGVTNAEPVPGVAHLAAWIEDGLHGEMVYMATTAHLRGDPRALLPRAQSVICVACAYHDQEDPPPAPDQVRVARYARRRDYHRLMRKKLVQLGRFLAQLAPEAVWRVTVDSAPLLEKELAQRAGLGWIGKNTCLINRRLGSELLLGELLTSLPLPPDKPETDHCGKCSACLRACPTKAFLGPYRLDARRCISYLTIEHKSPFPQGNTQELASYLFGCDLCQTCCPWNRHAPPCISPHLPTRQDLAFFNLAELQSISPADWAQKTQGTPLGRLSYARLQRNLATLLSTSVPQGQRLPLGGETSLDPSPP